MSDHDTLGILADEFVDRWRKGEFPTVAEYEQKHPDLAPSIRAVFPLVVALEKLKDDRERPPQPKKEEEAPDEIKKLGDFRIVRELGRGGMGVVYEAVQESLKRRVALKVLPKQFWMDGKGVKRFEREARTAANLHHQNIVPVFGFGEQDGHHYIVMQLIEGATLEDVLRGRESTRRVPRIDRTPQGLAKIALQGARAVQHAHEHGVLHGDIKPSNFMFDVNGTVWIADFGLSRSIESDSVSQSGSIFGTLEYMPPERFQGRTDLRSDVYSMGLTIYELYAGKPAFEDQDRSRLLKRVMAGDFPPPRQINAQIPREIETIVLKACALDPMDRYPTARELAEDLDCFVQGLPIKSRPASSMHRFAKWCGRNPVIAALSGVAAALLILVAVVASLGYVAQTEQRQRAEATSATALEALDKMFDRFSARQVGSVPVQVSAEDAELLQNLMTFYGRLSADDERKARAKLRVAHIRKWLGQYDEAIKAYEDVMATTEGLEKARLLNEIGSAHRMLSREAEARAAHEKAAALLTSNDPAHQFELARTYFLQWRRLIPGFSPNDKGPERGGGPPKEDRSEALRQLGKAAKILESLPATAETRFLLALCCRENTVDWLMIPNATTEKGIEMLEALAKEFPRVADYWYELAQTYLRFKSDRSDITIEHYKRAEGKLRAALERSKTVMADHPHVPEYMFALAQIHNRLSHVGERMGQTGFETHHRASIELLERLVDRFPNAPNYVSWLHRSRMPYAKFLYEQGRLTECRSILESAAALPIPAEAAFDTWNRLSDVCEKLGDGEAADRAREKAREYWEKMPRRD